MKAHANDARNLPVHPRARLVSSVFLSVPSLLIAIIFSVTLPAAVFAQQNHDASSGTTLSSTAELVLVPVQVKDSSGKSVRGLMQTDFVLRSDGKVQPIKIFEESGEIDKDQASSEKPGEDDASGEKEFSSVPEAGVSQQFLIIAVDQVNTPLAEQGRARQELLKYFEKDAAGQSFALVAITPLGLRQLQSPTFDSKILLAAMRQEQGSFGKTELTQESRVAPQPARCQLCGSEIAAYQNTAQANAAAATIESFAQLEQAYAGIPGRKSVIWLTSDPPEVDAISALLNRGNISLYALNVRAGQADTKYMGEEHIEYRTLDDNNSIGGARTVPPTTQVVGEQKLDDNTGLRSLASKTGGRYCASMAALQGCINQAVEDSSSYYLIGFYVAQQERVVGWHKLDVRLTSGREKVHARSGYYLEAKSALTDKDVRLELLAAASARIGYTGVAFTVQRIPASPATSVSSAASLSFRIHVPPSSVMLSPGEQKLSYEIVMVPLTDKGEPASDVMSTRLELNAEQSEVALAKGWRYDQSLAPASSFTAVKFLVRDNAADKIGSVIVPLNK